MSHGTLLEERSLGKAAIAQRLLSWERLGQPVINLFGVTHLSRAYSHGISVELSFAKRGFYFLSRIAAKNPSQG
jgi:hypothetical protein